jgi:ubiquinone/menaquinone biosynthesis C-methylase UbiE
VRAVFTGLVYVKRHKAAIVARHLASNGGAASSTTHLGALLDEIARSGVDITPVIVDHGWMEVRSSNGYEGFIRNEEFLAHIVKVHTDWTFRAKAYEKLQWVNDDVLLSGMTSVAAEVRPRTVLDVGTGSGKVLLGIRDVVPSAEFWGIDYSDAMMSRIPDAEGLTLRVCNAETLEGIPDDYFDLVTARMVFHHIRQPSLALTNIARVLRKGGCFVLCEGVPPSLRTSKWYTEMFQYKEDRTTLTEVDLINMLLEGGLTNVTTKTIVMKNCSLNNWLDNSGIPESNIDIIKEMHFNAPNHVREDYAMVFTDNDCLMTWKFAVSYGFKL